MKSTFSELEEIFNNNGIIDKHTFQNWVAKHVKEANFSHKVNMYDLMHQNQETYKQYVKNSASQALAKFIMDTMVITERHDPTTDDYIFTFSVSVLKND